jgi:hypothetical protein
VDHNLTSNVLERSPTGLTGHPDRPEPPASPPAPPPQIRELQDLANLIEDRWQKVHRDERRFAEIALEALARCPVHRLDLGQLFTWALTGPRLPSQADPDSTFGEPSLTVVNRGGFQVDLLFWLDGTTTIHQHQFSGAFRVVMGSSLHSEFYFTQRQRVSSRLSLGDLTFKRAELLEEGDTRPIHAGNRLIHSVFHLDRPSMTLVVRTGQEVDALPQFDYLPPGIAIDASLRRTSLRKRIQLLRTMTRLDHHSAVAEGVRQLFKWADLETAALLLRYPDVFSAFDAREELLEQRGRFGSAMDWLVPAYDHAQRMNALGLWRRVLRSVDLRLFLGLALNVPSRSAILSLVQQRYGGNPVELVMGWLRQLAELQRGVTEVRPLIEGELTEADLQSLQSLMDRPGGASVDPDSLGNIGRSPLLRPLLA